MENKLKHKGWNNSRLAWGAHGQVVLLCQLWPSAELLWLFEDMKEQKMVSWGSNNMTKRQRGENWEWSEIKE